MTQQFIESINPATEEVLDRFALFTPEQVDQALALARQVFLSWRNTPFDRRADLLRQAGAYLRAEKERLARLITAEMGKPIAQAEAEIEKCAWNCDHYAEHGEAYLVDQPHPSSSPTSYVAFDPLGPVLAIMPWNFPFWQVFRFAAPALMAGNTALLKHSSNVPQCALAIEAVFEAAGFPKGVFQTLLVSGATATQIIADSRVAAVTLTGSEATGRQVAAAAGRAIKKTVLELGGSDPFIVLADADLDAAAQTATRSRFLNAGQSCIAAKRFIVVEAVAEAFLKRFVAEVGALKVGDPACREIDVGPLARRDLCDALDRQIRDSIAGGASAIEGGHHLPGPGYFYAPTILTGVRPDMSVFQEETFGPVAAVMTVADTAAAIEAANDTRYGLGADIWTKDVEAARCLARQIQAGSVFINAMVSSDPRLPFGGVKRSGYGRELAEFGAREFTNVKTIWIGPAVEPQPQQKPSE